MNDAPVLEYHSGRCCRHWKRVVILCPVVKTAILLHFCDSIILLKSGLCERKIVKADHIYVPDPKNKDVYERNYKVFKKLYKTNASNFRELNQ